MFRAQWGGPLLLFLGWPLVFYEHSINRQHHKIKFDFILQIENCSNKYSEILSCARTGGLKPRLGPNSPLAVLNHVVGQNPFTCPPHGLNSWAVWSACLGGGFYWRPRVPGTRQYISADLYSLNRQELLTENRFFFYGAHLSPLYFIIATYLLIHYPSSFRLISLIICVQKSRILYLPKSSNKHDHG